MNPIGAPAAASIPTGLAKSSPHREAGRLAPTLAGEPPSPIGDRQGCAFLNRCPLATTERCQLQAPILSSVAQSSVACHLAH